MRSSITLVLFSLLLSVACQNFEDEGKRCGLPPTYYACEGDTHCLMPGKRFSSRSGYCVKNLELLATETECSEEKPCGKDFACKQFGPERSFRCVNVQHLAGPGEKCTTIQGGTCLQGYVCEKKGDNGFNGVCKKE